MNRTIRIFMALAAAAFIISGGGCASLDPDNFLPKTIAPAGPDHRFGGTVIVQSALPGVSRGKFLLSADGSQAIMPDTKRGRVALYHSGMLRGALEKALAQSGLFQGIEQGDADYVLDVWIIDSLRQFEYLGEGMLIDLTAVWRLTRTKDGKVVFCDFVSGHGGSHGLGSNAYVSAMEIATREMIRKGLAKLSERPSSLAALHLAGDWPSMGSAVPADYKRIKENWPKLRKGMTEKEARDLIPSLPPASCSIITNYTDQFYNTRNEIYPLRELKISQPCGWNTRDVTVDFRIIGGSVIMGNIRAINREFIEPFHPFYKLTFVKGALEHWELSK